MFDVHDQETTLGGRAPSPDTFVSRGRIDPISRGIGASQESSTRLTENRDVDDVARGVAVLFPSRSSPRPWSGLCPLPTICEESASEDEDERESMGSRAPRTETDVLSDTPAHGPGRVTTDPSLQDLGTASRQLGSIDDITFIGAGVCASGTGDALDVVLGLSTDDNGSQGYVPLLSDRVKVYNTVLHRQPRFIPCLYALYGRWLQATLWRNVANVPRRRRRRTYSLPIPTLAHQGRWEGCVDLPARRG